MLSNERLEDLARVGGKTPTWLEAQAMAEMLLAIRERARQRLRLGAVAAGGRLDKLSEWAQARFCEDAVRVAEFVVYGDGAQAPVERRYSEEEVVAFAATALLDALGIDGDADGTKLELLRRLRGEVATCQRCGQPVRGDGGGVLFCLNEACQ